MKAAILTRLILVAGLIATCGSCRRVDNVVYADFAAFGTDGWDPICVIPFTPWPADSIVNPGDRFDIILTLRYSPRDASSEIPLEVTEEDENGIMQTRRMTVRLRGDNGKLRGKKSIFLYEISDTLRNDFKIPDGYMVEIASLSPASNTLGLRNIGLTMILKENK